MLRTGFDKQYYWLEISSELKNLSKFIEQFDTFLLDKSLSIISFDCGPLIPTIEEIERGWKYKNEIASFDKLNEHELDSPIFDNSYDQWLLFDKPTEITSCTKFVNYNAFSLHMNFADMHIGNLEIQNEFWTEIKELKPSQFIICGDNFIYGTKDKQQIDEVINAWC